jgi:hypothetical protein
MTDVLSAPRRRARRPRRRISALTAWPWPLAAAAVGVVAVASPLAALAVVGGAVVVGLTAIAPGAVVGFTVFAVLFVRPLEHLIPVSTLGYLDEVLVLLCAVVLPLRRLARGGRLRAFPGQWWFAGFAVAGLLSGIALGVAPVTFGSGAAVICKGLVFAWAVAQVDWEERHLRVAAGGGAVLVIACLVATALNYVLPGPWNAVMASDPNAIESRGILPSLVGPFSHPIDLGQFMALSAIALTAWRIAVRRGPLTFALMVATAAGAVLSARRTAISSLVAGWLWVKAVGRSTGALLAIAVCVPLAALVLAAPIGVVVSSTYQDYISPHGEPEARTVLTLDSIGVAADHFPAGAGFGRFGSAIAAETYSPEYVARGYPDIWGLGRTEEDGRFLTDTEWPAIIGETGFLGTAAFAFGLFAIHRASRRLWLSSAPPLHRWAGLVAVGWTVACLVQSVATVTFTGPPIYGLYFGLVGVVTALADRREAEPSSEYLHSTNRRADSGGEHDR